MFRELRAASGALPDLHWRNDRPAFHRAENRSFFYLHFFSIFSEALRNSIALLLAALITFAKRCGSALPQRYVLPTAQHSCHQ